MKTNKNIFSLVRFLLPLSYSIAMFTLFTFSFSYATIRYVSKTGLSIPPYTSWETAADSIQECINISVSGDTIYVANGVYEEQVTMINGLSLIGAGADSCQINTQALATTTSFRSVIVKDTCLFRGFKIIVAYNSELGGGIGGSAINSLIEYNRITKAKYGIVNGSNVVIYKNIIENISTGIEVFNSNAWVRNNFIYTDPNSQAAIIAGIYIEAFDFSYTPIIDSNYIEVPSIGGRGINKSFGARPVITNNIIKLIHGQEGIFIGYTDSTKVYNNLIIGEPGIRGVTDGFEQDIKNNLVKGVSSAFRISGEVKNNIATNSGKGIESFGNPIIQYNNSWNNETNYSGFTPDTTNISVDPMIVNDDTTQGKLDFHLQMYSPLIDAGDPTILDKDSTRSDIGLYGGPYGESYIYLDLPPRPPVNLNATVQDGAITLTWNKNTEADTNHYNVYRDTSANFTIDSTNLVSSRTNTICTQIIPQGVEKLYFKITAVDNQGNESNPSEEVSVILVSVKGEWQAVNNYMLYQNYPNPFNPKTKIGYKLKERGYVKLYVYDIKGELVSVLVNQTQEAGYYEVEFDASLGSRQSAAGNQLASGVYIYQIMVRNERDPSKPGPNGIPVFTDIKKMVYIK